jgi:large conductance mechanosensitive channel
LLIKRRPKDAFLLWWIMYICHSSKTKIMSFTSEFKDFVSRGNVVDLAVGLVIGAAFAKIVDSLVADIIMPPLGLMIGGVNFTDLKVILKAASVDAGGAVVPAVTVNYGNLIQNIFNFLVIALAIFSFVVKPMNKMKAKEAPAAAAPSATKEEMLLTEIRDLLKK